MAKGFFDIETAEPAAGSNTDLKDAEDMEQARQQALEQAEALKATIARQLEAGEDPQTILYTALKVIGLLSNDQEYTETTQGKLDAVYKDLTQLSFIQDNNRIAQERLDAIKEEYNAKLRKNINTQLARYAKVEKALNDVLYALNDTEPRPADPEQQ